MKKLLSFLFIFLALLVFVTSASAQSSIADDFLLKSTVDLIPNPKGEGDAVKSPTKAGFARNVIQGLVMENKEMVENANEGFGKMRKSYKKDWDANYYSIFESHVDTMHSDAVKDFMNVSGKGIVALYKYAQLQTEPSIATGSSLAQNLVFDLQRQALESDRAFRDQLEANPQLREVALASYNGCLREQLKAQKKWVEAIAICQNDKIPQGNYTGNFKNLTGVKLDPAKHHPDRYKAGRIHNHTSPPPGVNLAKSVSVLDSLLNQAVASGINNKAAQDFGRNFEKWFGDYLIELADGESDSQIILKEARIAPQKSLSQLVEELADLRFKAMMELLSAACNHMKSGGGAVSAGAKIGDEAAARDFWTGPALTAHREKLRDLSVPELPFTRILGDSMINFIVYKSAEKTTSTSCEEWSKVDVRDIKDDDPNLDVYNLYYIYAHVLSTHQLIWSFEKALELTSKLSGLGDNYNPIRTKAYSLIEEPFGTLDFAKLKQQNLKILVETLDKKVFEEQIHLTGQASSRTLASVNQSSTQGAS